MFNARSTERLALLDSIKTTSRMLRVCDLISDSMYTKSRLMSLESCTLIMAQLDYYPRAA